MAAYHVSRFGGFPNVTLSACYDRSRDRARRFASVHSIPHAYDSFERMLAEEQPDAVAVAVADAEHFAVSRRSLERGVALFVEKPLTRTLEEAELLGNLDCSIPAVCNFSKVNYPALFGAVHLIRQGVIGELKRVELSYLQSWLGSTIWGEWWRNPRWLWRLSSSHGGGGALRDLGSHLFYLLRVIVGESSVTAASSWQAESRRLAEGSGYTCDQDDTAEVSLISDGGAESIVRVSYAAPGHVNNVILVARGETGTLHVELAESKEEVTVRRRASKNSGVEDTGERRYRFSKVYSTYDEFIRLVTGGWANTHWFSPPSIKDGIEVQRLIEGAESRSGSSLR